MESSKFTANCKDDDVDGGKSGQFGTGRDRKDDADKVLPSYHRKKVDRRIDG